MLCEQVARFAGDAGVSAWYLLRAAFVYNYQSSCCSIRRSSGNSRQTDSDSVWRLRCVHQCVLEQVCASLALAPLPLLSSYKSEKSLCWSRYAKVRQAFQTDVRNSVTSMGWTSLFKTFDTDGRQDSL